ncbi:MAG: Cytochrome bo(3) ubiquinol oxidase subunit 3 [Chlamydiales bacterium]|nr:Cytochrome bo(3) ubiquinol oxidase subunit 3 [Chlamydiales bacterium]MCH9635858.1 Cytochrome bo(3) ubiquinol oxidase subunit 3 [Chlamydiales bacterium]MCH9703568.1 cytochrome o ubiquinol oxidase subunit III [Chlamydiota bacterium]
MKAIVKNHELYNKTLFGFWVYLMTDCVLFGTLFATYIVLHTHNFGGPTTQELFSLPLAFWETMVLLTSSFTIGLARLDAHIGKTKRILFWLVITFLLGASFIAMELHEFITFVHEGNSWQRSAFLSSYFTLVATHGCHISVGLIWMIMTFIMLAKKGVTEHNFRRLTCLGLFWHFLDIVWIFIFSVVYLMGVLP